MIKLQLKLNASSHFCIGDWALSGKILSPRYWDP